MSNLLVFLNKTRHILNLSNIEKEADIPKSCLLKAINGITLDVSERYRVQVIKVLCTYFEGVDLEGNSISCKENQWAINGRACTESEVLHIS